MLTAHYWPLVALKSIVWPICGICSLICILLSLIFSYIISISYSFILYEFPLLNSSDMTTWYCFQMQSSEILTAVTHYKTPSGTNCQDLPSLYQTFLGLYNICPSLGSLLPHSIYHTPYPIVYHSWVIKVLRFLTWNNDLDLTSSPITWRQTPREYLLKIPMQASHSW